MKLQTLYLSYIDLTPGLENNYADLTHKELINILRNHFFSWRSFFLSYDKDYSIGFFISTKKGTSNVNVYGPSKSKKKKIVDYSIFLPDEIIDLNHYINLVFEGIGTVLAKYEVSENEVVGMRDECKRELGV